MSISRLFYKDTHVLLMKRDERFFISIRYADQPCTLADGLRRWPEMQPIAPYFGKDENTREAQVPVGKLNKVLETLSALEAKYARLHKLVFYVQPEICRVQVRSAPPPEFCLNYLWENRRLRRVVPEGTVELSDGWYRKGDIYWSYPSLSEMDRRRIRRAYIDKQELLEFLQRDLTAYAAAGVRYTCELHQDTIPVLEMLIISVEADVVQIREKWNVPPEHIDPQFDLNGYVVAGRTLRPGIRPSILAERLKFEGETATLRGIEIARFLDEHYLALKPWIIGGTQPFEAVHFFIRPPYEWILVASAEPIHGIGKALAKPKALIGKEEFTVEALTQLMQAPYARIAAGWVRRKDLYTLGIDTKGKWTGQGTMKPVQLSATQIICRGDAHLKGPWGRMEMRGVPWCASSVKQRAAREHLAYLIHWGIPGGIVGGYESAAVYGVELLSSLLVVEAQARILVVGDKADVEEFMSLSGGYQPLPAQQYEAGRGNVVYCAVFDKLGKVPAIREVSWDLLMLIEPDVIYTSGKKTTLEEVRQLSAGCRIGFFAREFDASNQEAIRTQKTVLKLDAGDDILKELIQNPRAITPLPAAFVFTPLAPILASDAGFEIVLSGEEAKGSPVPPREQAMRTETRYASEVEVHSSASPGAPVVRPAMMIGSTLNEGFLREARKLEGIGGASRAQHVPFSCYWPKYSDMNVEQRNWYFHLRGRMRQGEYPDTDLSYLFVRIYELLNVIGCNNDAAAYRELMDIWVHYRERHPRLDKHLSEWTLDFICTRQPGIGAWQHMKGAPAMTPAGVNAALTQRDANESLVLALPALEMLGDYWIRQSKFYLSGHADLIERLLPLAIAFVDAHIHQKEAGGLLARFPQASVTERRSAFASAIVEPPVEYVLTYVPYCTCQPLKGLISQMLRYAENALRDQCGFGAKLRGVTLDKSYSDLIDAYIAKQYARKPEVHAAPRMTLDVKVIDRLRGESDEVRDTLIASMEQQESAMVTGDIQVPGRPSDTPEGLLTDLEPVSRILHELTQEQCKILEYLRANAWEQDAEECARAFPSLLMEAELDVLNTHSIRFLGAQLIAREGAVFAVADDYRDEIAYLMQHPQEQPVSTWKVELEGLEPEWVDFFRAGDLEVLGAVLNGELAQFASRWGAMPDLLVDALNAAAMETVGDLIVNGDTLVDEYLPLIAAHLRKA